MGFGGEREGLRVPAGEGDGRTRVGQRPSSSASTPATRAGSARSAHGQPKPLGALAILGSLGVLAALLTAALPATTTFAQPTGAADADERSESDRRAEELFLLGDSLYEQGRYEAAITTFQEAFRLSGRHLLLYNIANAQERAGRWADAVVTLRTYMEYAPTSERAAIESRIERLEERIAEREAAEAAAAQTEPDTVPTPTEVAETAEIAAPDETTETGPPTLGLSLTVSGAALVVVGAGLGIGSLLQRNEAEEQCADSGSATLCPGDVRDQLDRSRAMAIAADVTVALGVVATALGVYFWVSDDDEERREVSFSPLRGGGALEFGGSF